MVLTNVRDIQRLVQMARCRVLLCPTQKPYIYNVLLLYQTTVVTNYYRHLRYISAIYIKISPYEEIFFEFVPKNIIYTIHTGYFIVFFG